MATDLTVGLMNRPGTLAQASDALGRAGVNIEGACGFVSGDQAVYHGVLHDHADQPGPTQVALAELRAGEILVVEASHAHRLVRAGGRRSVH